MTAFGRAQKHDATYQIAVEISSVNRRHAEIIVKMPSGYIELEPLVRKELTKEIGRGQVTILVDIVPLNAETIISTTNWMWIEAQARAAQEIGKRLCVDIRKDKVALELWRQSLTQKEVKDCSQISSLLLSTLHEAFHEFDKRRNEEGKSIEVDFVARMKELRSYHEKIIELSQNQVELVREKIRTLLDGVVAEAFSSDERVMREVVLQADKADVSEELVRIRHHLDHLEKTLCEKKAVGKLFEFILQELLREFNTLGAKTLFPSVSTIVVLAKTELEKMREQIQNVE